MGIVDILEDKVRFKGLLKHILGPREIEFHSTVLCSCKNVYKIRDRLDFRDHSVYKTYTCSKCGESDVVKYEVKVTDRSNGYDGYWAAHIDIGLVKLQDLLSCARIG